MEDKFVELTMSFTEVKSCLIVLQQAVQNEHDELTLDNIDHSLETIIDKLSRVIDEFETFGGELLNNNGVVIILHHYKYFKSHLGYQSYIGSQLPLALIP